MRKYIKSVIALLLAATFCVSCGSKGGHLQKEPPLSGDNGAQSGSDSQNKPNSDIPGMPGDGNGIDGSNHDGSETPETGDGSSDSGGEAPDGSNEKGPSPDTLRINEVLYENSVFRFNGGGAYCFIELYNYGDETVDLDGFSLRCADVEASLSGTVPSGQYKLIFPGADVNENLGIGILSIRLSKQCTIELLDDEKELVQSVTLPDLKKDISYAYQADYIGTYTDAEYVKTSLVTPGYENSITGLESWYSQNDSNSSLVINEAMSSNREYVKTLNTYYDWIELRNVSSDTLSLGSYYLSDKESNLKKWQLPNVELAAGETFFVYAESDDAKLLTSKGYVCCGFSLSGDREQIYLSDENGTVLDAMLITATTENGSYGRMEGKKGFFYFTTPTPKTLNEGGVRAIATTPVTSNPGGVFNDTDGQTVSIVGEGTIYYTLDGSLPTKNSKKYNGGTISVTKTGVLRAISVSEGKANSRAVTAAFILNENHKLPVLSIAIDPEDMYGDKTGIYVVGEGNDPDAWAGQANYTKDWEKSVHATFFETDGSGFSLDCGIKIAGSGTRAFPKKSFQLKFRGIYGASELQYDIFGTGVEAFQNIKLRCGEDYYRTTFRDELQAALAMDMGGLLAQRYRWFVLYIDGEYFGLYAFRDMTDENYVSKVEGVDPTQVTILEHDGVGKIDGKKDYHKEFLALVDYCVAKDLSNYEYYRYVTDRIDIESFTKWFIARSYGSDRDFGNCRFYRIGDDGKWKTMFYDCDWGFYYEYMKRSPYDVFNQSRYDVFPAIKIMKALFKNPEYKDYFLTTLGEQLRGAYKADNILSKIEAFDALLHSEIPRDREKWDKPGYSGTYEKYVYMLEELKKFAKECPTYLIQSTKDYFKLTDSQMKQYFDGIL